MEAANVDEKIRLLLANLGSGWTGGSPVLNRLVDAVPGAAAPLEAFKRLVSTTFNGASSSLDQIFEGHAGDQLEEAAAALTAYLSADTWYDRAAPSDPGLAQLRQRPIAYFCAEFGLEEWLPIYSGGLGILAGDMVKEASDLGLPFVAVGLLYRHGYFNQRLDSSGYQHEEYPTLHPRELPLEPVRTHAGEDLIVEVPIADRLVYARVWKILVGRVTLYLLDTDTPPNDRADDRAITANLYGGDAETRIQQELVLGIGGVRALQAMGIDPSVFSMNEGHAAFLGVELLLDDLPSHGLATALDMTRNRIVYTNHTVVPAGNDVFPRELLERYIAPYTSRRGLAADDLLALGGEAGFSMAILAFRLAAKANAVSRIHADAIRSEPAWSRFPVEAVTNGVHVPTWLGASMQQLLHGSVPFWREDDPEWDIFDAVDSAALWSAKSNQREAMVRAVNRRVEGARLDPDVLTIVWARRFAQYKRAGLLAGDMERLARIVSNRDRPVQIIISGKAHPKDEGGKRMLQELLHQFGDHQDIGPHFAFVPDYRIGVAHDLVQGADVWLNTPR
ncbi:MAG TPA: alpha-glucan family phosphorylase, partial [Chloroflexota bacterium]|nr:alpha-glucan family phosphorylase [Chloroflexota bacterium]